MNICRRLSVAAAVAIVAGCVATPFPEITTRINQLPEQRDGYPQGFGVVICGDQEQRHIDSTRQAVRALRVKGFAHIFELNAWDASTDNIEYIFARLSRIVDTYDVVWFHFSGHGVKSSWRRSCTRSQIFPGIYTLSPAIPIRRMSPGGAVVGNDMLTPEEFVGYIEMLRPRFGVAVVGGCYSGRFLTNVDRWMVMTGSANNEKAYGEFEPSFYAHMLASPNDEVGYWFDGARSACKRVHPQIVRGLGCERNVIIPNFK